MDAESVSTRLRQLSAFSMASTPAASSVDMSSRGVTTRLIECAEISALAWELAKAGAAAEGAGPDEG